MRTLSERLEGEFGRGFGEKSLRRMVQFAEAFSDPQIVATLSRQLGWSHFKEILPLADPLKRDFYAEMCRIKIGDFKPADMEAFEDRPSRGTTRRERMRWRRG